MKSLMKQKIFNRVKFKKYIFIFLTLIFVLNITPVLADDDFETGCVSGLFGGGDVCYKSEIAIPGFPDYEFKVKSNTLGLYIKAIYEYLLYVAGVLAVIVIMVGGFQWITAGGNQSKIGEAKERVMGAVIGLFLALSSYLLLYTINPDLVEIVDLNVDKIETLICASGDTVCYNNNDCNVETNWFDGADAICGKEHKLQGTDRVCYGDSCEDSTEICVNNQCITDPDRICINVGDACLTSEDGQGYCSIYHACIPCVPLNGTCSASSQCCQGETGAYCLLQIHKCMEGSLPHF